MNSHSPSYSSFDLCLIRHGETTANRDGIMQGQSDFPLTDLGIHQANTVRAALKHINWNLAYSSDLTRAVDTARIILGDLDGIELRQRQEIREHHFGFREGNHPLNINSLYNIVVIYLL